jgi:tetraacyldisaccharide-1-P 4'-kinase
MVGATDDDAAALVEAGLWIASDDGYRIHNWTEYQTLTVSERRAEAGRKGGLVSGQKRSKSQANAKQTRSKNDLLTKQTHEAGTHPIPTRPVKPSSEPSATETVTAAIDEAVRQRQATTTGIRNPEAWRRTVREQMTTEENAIAKATRLIEQYPTANASQIAAALNGSTVALRLLHRETLPNDLATSENA